MGRILLTGATGTLGTALRRTLTTAGHTVRAASRTPPTASADGVEWVELDLRSETDLSSVVDGTTEIIHAATAPRGDAKAVDVTGTKRLLAAAQNAGVRKFIYPSIVGIDRIPYSYYTHKLQAETLIQEHDIPAVIVRSTQFYSFIADLLSALSKLPIWLLPTQVRLQPVAVTELAAAISARISTAETGRVEPVGGPSVLTVGEIAETYRAVRGLRRPVVRLPIPGTTMKRLRTGAATCPAQTRGTLTWRAWLTEQYSEER